MINLNEFSEVSPSKRVLDEDLKQALFRALQKVEKTLTNFSDIDFTVYEGIGNFKSGPYRYSHEGKELLPKDIPVNNHYAFDKIPTLLLADTYNHLKPSEFVVEAHPSQDYLVKIQLSVGNHFEFLVLSEHIFILSVNQIDVVTKVALERPNISAELRNLKIEAQWMKGEVGSIAHKLASEFHQPTELYRREELEYAEPWLIIGKRRLDKTEQFYLSQHNHKLSILIPIITVFAGSWLFSTDSWFWVIIGGIILLYGLIKSYLGKTRCVDSQEMIKISGQLRVHPKTIFTGPINIRLFDESIASKVAKDVLYEFEVNQTTREVMVIESLFDFKNNPISQRAIRNFLIFSVISLGVIWLKLSFHAHPYDMEMNFIDKSRTYFDMLSKPSQPLTQVNFQSQPDFVPKQWQKIQISSLVQCDNQKYIQLCDKVHLLPTQADANPVTVEPDGKHFERNDETRYFSALNRHYLTLKPSNEILLRVDYANSPVFKILARNRSFFISYDRFLAHDMTLRHDLEPEGFAYLSQPFYMTLKGIVTHVDFKDTPNKRWIMHLTHEITDEQLKQARYFIALLVIFSLVSGLVLSVIGYFFYGIGQIRKISA